MTQHIHTSPLPPCVGGASFRHGEGLRTCCSIWYGREYKCSLRRSWCTCTGSLIRLQARANHHQPLEQRPATDQHAKNKQENNRFLLYFCEIARVPPRNWLSESKDIILPALELEKVSSTTDRICPRISTSKISRTRKQNAILDSRATVVRVAVIAWR